MPAPLESMAVRGTASLGTPPFLRLVRGRGVRPEPLERFLFRGAPIAGATIIEVFVDAETFRRLRAGFERQPGRLARKKTSMFEGEARLATTLVGNDGHGMPGIGEVNVLLFRRRPL